MRFVAVTACPTGVAHTHLAAEALKRQASVMGHHVDVETQGAGGTAERLDPEAIAAADAVIIAADIHVDPARFAGKPMHAVSTAEAIRHTARVISDAVGAVAAAAGDVADQVEAEEAGVVAAPPPLPIAPSVAGDRQGSSSASRRVRRASPTRSWPPRGCGAPPSSSGTR